MPAGEHRRGKCFLSPKFLKFIQTPLAGRLQRNGTHDGLNKLLREPFPHDNLNGFVHSWNFLVDGSPTINHVHEYPKITIYLKEILLWAERGGAIIQER